ncbi:hypothetical protein SUGI_0866120 [Cryptomeria japonica]|nr:hypothetical protein SUGI_0866120 [Cryptomeria japonica]
MALNFDCLSNLLCEEDADWDDEVTSSSFPEDKVENLKSIELARLPDFPVEKEEMISLLALSSLDYVESY